MTRIQATEMLLFAPEPAPEVVEELTPTQLLDVPEPEGVLAGTEDLTHGQVVERIMRLNTSATLEFLAPFTTPKLRDYMDHLVCSRTPRGSRSVWSRRADSPAILSSESGL